MKILKNSNEAVAGVLTALLLILLFVSILAFIQSVYVPQWMKQRESEHMGELANQFGQLKFSIDTLSVNSREYSQIAIPIRLGSEEMPFFDTIRSYGSLNIIPNDCRIRIDDDDDISVSYILGSIKYDSENSYYLDQTFIYENGALILNQSTSEIITIEPAVSVVNQEDLTIEIIKLSVVGEKSSASGFGTYPIQTKFLNSRIDQINNVKNITLNTEHRKAWYTFFNNILSKSNLIYTISYTHNNDGILIKFYDGSDIYYPDLTLIITEIEVQISLGIVT